ncbi:hypothetical protein [Streptomyces sp. AK04-3B]|uniref:hypothetical protein n=1 Tax=unclassified Streptomyces TaxID=2593676 RepID=UPI0029A99D74|nr:hypothetical protein [Streptomyces sp. AK04-3B]MDX3797756.1 hypothetical protein [Streptomyces sp. AK04-3B]
MSYDLQAVIAGEEVLNAASRVLSAARVASLGQGVSLMPMTDALFDSVSEGGDTGALGFWRLPGGFAKTLADWSTAGPVAYVEAEYFGGVGEQQAVVWDGGTIVLGPLQVPEGHPFPPAGSAISQALRRLGVVADAGEDEFTALGLERHRHGEGWIA